MWTQAHIQQMLDRQANVIQDAGFAHQGYLDAWLIERYPICQKIGVPCCCEIFRDRHQEKQIQVRRISVEAQGVVVRAVADKRIRQRQRISIPQTHQQLEHLAGQVRPDIDHRLRKDRLIAGHAVRAVQV